MRRKERAKRGKNDRERVRTGPRVPAGDAEARRAAGDVGKGQNGLFWTALFQRWQTTQTPCNAARGLAESAHAWRVYRAAQDLKRCTGSLRPAHLKKWYKILVPLLREASRARTPSSSRARHPASPSRRPRGPRGTPRGLNDASGPPASGEPGAGSGAAAKVLRGALKDAAGVRRGGLVLGPPYKPSKR